MAVLCSFVLFEEVFYLCSYNISLWLLFFVCSIVFRHKLMSVLNRYFYILQSLCYIMPACGVFPHEVGLSIPNLPFVAASWASGAGCSWWDPHELPLALAVKKLSGGGWGYLFLALSIAKCLLSLRCVVGVSQSAWHRERVCGCKVMFPFQFSCLECDALC